MCRLDALDLSTSPEASMLKLDVQGFEMRVLRHGRQALRRFALVEMEMPFVPVFRDAATCDELVAEMRARGFGLVSVQPNTIDPQRGHVVEIDALFARRA